MKLYLCTLFDSNYLDKGLVLYDSLEKCCRDYTLYLLPMDNTCAEVLEDLRLESTVLIDYNDFEDEDLKRVKSDRTHAEFCWTCTAKLIKYVINKFDIPMCTYIDADLYFYENPEILIQEMLDSGSSVQIVRHNFRKFERKDSERLAGKFCVEFNTFLCNQEGMEVLASWEADCVKECSYGKNNKVMGDQKYLETWPKRFKCINICSNQGAGVAPWNINKFIYEKKGIDHYEIIDKENKKHYPLVFYHFQNVCFMSHKEIECCVVSRKLMDSASDIYTRYLKRIVEKKKFLYQKYGMASMIKVHPAEVNKPKRITNIKKAKGINRIGHVVKSCYLIGRANLLHFVYCRNDEKLIIRLD